MDKNKVISVANIIFKFKYLFYKFIKFIEIYICKKLGGQVADRQPSFNAPPPQALEPLFSFVGKPINLSHKNSKTFLSEILLARSFFNISWSTEAKNF